MSIHRLEDSSFPVDLLPNIGHPGREVGKLKFEWCGFKEGTRILIACGDMQCSVYSCDPNENVAGRCAVIAVNLNDICILAFIL